MERVFKHFSSYNGKTIVQLKGGMILSTFLKILKSLQLASCRLTLF